MIQVRMKGVKEAVAELPRIRTFMPEARRKVMAPFAKEAAEKLQDMIRQQHIEGKGLDDKYKRRKERLGLDGRTLIRTGGYVDGIKGAMNQQGAVFVYPTGKQPDTGIAYSKLALYLEYGTKRMPGRPHWVPLAKWGAKRATVLLKQAIRLAMAMAAKTRKKV